MTQYEFVSYEKTPNDGLQQGIATVDYQGLLIRFRHMQKKDGSATYFASPSCCITDEQQQKRYVDGLEIDSSKAKDQLMQFLRQSVANQGARAQASYTAPSAFDYPKVEVTRQNADIKHSKKDEELPF